jgi:hypothetical protein
MVNKIHAVAFMEGDTWVIQGIEHDIVAHAKDVTALPYAFMRAITENVFVGQHLGRKPLEGIRPAPERFRELYENAQVEVRPTRRNKSDPEVAVRVAA